MVLGTTITLNPTNRQIEDVAPRLRALGGKAIWQNADWRQVR